MAYGHAERNLLALESLARQTEQLLDDLQATDPGRADQLRALFEGNDSVAARPSANSEATRYGHAGNRASRDPRGGSPGARAVLRQESTCAKHMRCSKVALRSDQVPLGLQLNAFSTLKECIEGVPAPSNASGVD
jgi:hypothetical protein